MGKRECQDHLGNKFKSLKEMCEHYGITRKNFKDRIKLGWTLEDALTIKIGQGHEHTGDRYACYDHLGNKFASIVEMCKYYKVNVGTVHSRIKLGWTLEDALTKDANSAVGCCDHLGNKFTSIREMCRHYGIHMNTFSGRIQHGWSLEDALTSKYDSKKAPYDHLGNKFNTVEELCKHYKISRTLLNSRLKSGWSLEDALTIKHSPLIKECKDHLGNAFKSESEMCRYWGINNTTYRCRVTSGWLVDEALGTKGRGLDASIKNKEILNKNINNIQFAYKGRNNKYYYTCNDLNTGEELLLNADEILVYKQKDYKTAVEQLIQRRRKV